MSKRSYSCLSIQVLDQIGQNEISPDELLSIEAHLTDCLRCREMFDSLANSAQWSEHIRPALQDTQSDSFLSDDEANHRPAVLNLLGPTDDPNMLGRIGNYEIAGVIGQGGMGVVFKGFDRSLNRFVAIKMLLPHLAASGAARKRFAREGQAVAAVVDDHVMAIHCVDEWQGVPYLVMTYSRGISLQKRLNENGPLEVREILRIGMQAAKGLAAAHAQGIVHRDIKPSNILLDKKVERVQLVDFGLARAVDDASLTCSGTLAGTPQYMSPEQARAESVDHRSDLFSLGSVLYTMCTGHPPFRAESSYSVLRLITDREPRPIRELNSDVPEWLCAIIGTLMSKSPDGRYTLAGEVASILEQCLAHVQDPMQHALPLVKNALNERSKSQSVIVSILQRWFPKMNDKRILALISLLLLVMALLLTWPIAALGNGVNGAIAFATPALLLSFGLALLSRSEYFARIVLWCFGLSFACAVVGICVSVPIKLLREQSFVAQAREAETVARKQAEIQAKNQQLKAESDANASKTNMEPNFGNPKAAASEGTRNEGLGSPRANVDLNQPGKSIDGSKGGVEQATGAPIDPMTVAIERFNDRIRQKYPFHDQPLLTKDELVACVSWNVDGNDDLSETWKIGLIPIAKQHRLPAGWTIEGDYIDMPPEATPVRAFQIFLRRDPSDERFIIRERFVAPSNSYSKVTGQHEPDAGVSLASAVKHFNAGHSRADGKKQPPLTEDEVVAAIIHRQALRDDEDVSDSLFDRFQNIARTRHLPDGATLEVIPTFGVEGGSTYTIWSIRLTMLQDEPGKERWTYGFKIREQFVSVKHGDAGSIHWGTPAENGLQAGVRLSPPLLSYQFGQKIGVEVLYRNILTKPLTATVPNFPDYEVDVLDLDGTRPEVVDPLKEKIIGGWRAERIGDEPISLRGRPLVLMPTKLSPDERAKASSQADDQVLIFAKPGKRCRLQFIVSNYASDAMGQLKTGEVEFAVSQSLSIVDRNPSAASE